MITRIVGVFRVGFTDNYTSGLEPRVYKWAITIDHRLGDTVIPIDELECINHDANWGAIAFSLCGGNFVVVSNPRGSASKLKQDYNRICEFLDALDALEEA